MKWARFLKYWNFSMIKSDLLNSLEYVNHGFFGRDCNIASYQSENDRKESYDTIANALDLGDMASIKVVNQIHSDKIINVIDSDQNTVQPADGLFSNLSNIGLGVKGADCPSVLFAAKTKKYICAVHAGWRGAFAGIHINAVQSFKENGVDPKDIIAVIGPCITQKSYEVDQGFLDNFIGIL